MLEGFTEGILQVSIVLCVSESNKCRRIFLQPGSHSNLNP